MNCPALTLQGTRQGLVHVPRLPLRPPAQLDNRQRPETEKQNCDLHEDLGFYAWYFRRGGDFVEGHFAGQDHAVCT